jgi:Ner family transcriptional regulator
MKSNARSSKPEVNADWHPADVVAALRKAGWSLRKLSRHHGYQPTVLSSALHRHWPKAECLIASVIGVPPDQIWPSRYQSKAS